MKKTKFVWEVYRNKGAMILVIGLIANIVSRYIFDEEAFAGYKPSILLCIGFGSVLLMASLVARRFMPTAVAKIISRKTNVVRFIIFMVLITVAAILISR